MKRKMYYLLVYPSSFPRHAVRDAFVLAHGEGLLALRGAYDSGLPEAFGVHVTYVAVELAAGCVPALSVHGVAASAVHHVDAAHYATAVARFRGLPCDVYPVVSCEPWVLYGRVEGAWVAQDIGTYSDVMAKLRLRAPIGGNARCTECKQWVVARKNDVKAMEKALGEAVTLC